MAKSVKPTNSSIAVIAVNFSGVITRESQQSRIKSGKLFITSGKKIINVPVAAKN
ncbi:MAG: hypothetical protein FWF68_06470 [Spirochaetes bacterium]|nr:hypothetical protein [Spirochaetota bacterium]